MARMSVSVLGLGAMGAAFARALLRGGHEVTVWNRTAARAEPFAAEGATVAPDPAAAVAAGDVAVLILPVYADVHEVVESPGTQEVLGGKIVVNLTTGHAEEAVELQRRLAELGADYLDGRVGAYPEGLGTDHSNTFYSGPADVYERARPALESMGADAFHVGEEIGAANGLAFSMVTVLHHLQVIGFYEAAALADRFGLPAKVWTKLALPILGLTRQAMERGAQQLQTGDYEGSQATLEIHAEAIEMAQKAMVELGAPHAMTDAALGYLDRARERGDAQREIAVLFDVLKEPAAGARV
jgi:3-hydroxyisobutyrate dehydrogenase-like beta-hydroxyacid dehydrogenase